LLISEVTQAGLKSMQLMGMQNDPEGELARSRYEKITCKKWTSPNNIAKPEVKKTEPAYPTKMSAKLCVFLLKTYNFVYVYPEFYKDIRTNIYKYAGISSFYKGLTISVDSTGTWRVYQNKFFEAVGHTPEELKEFLELCRG
jgi:hypothetical protein